MDGLSIAALVVCVLTTKMAAVALVQGVARLRTRRFRHAEDAVYFGAGTGLVDDPPLAVLGQHALQNDLENLPGFGLLLLSYALLGGSVTVTALHGALFVLARIVHTAAFLRPTQPLRNRAYSVGLLTTLSLVAFTVGRALSD